MSSICSRKSTACVAFVCYGVALRGAPVGWMPFSGVIVQRWNSLDLSALVLKQGSMEIRHDNQTNSRSLGDFTISCVIPEGFGHS